MSTHEHICSRNFCIGQHKLHREDLGPIPDKVSSLPTIGKAKNQSRSHLLRVSRSLCSAGECLAWIISAACHIRREQNFGPHMESRRAWRWVEAQIELVLQ
jgi:hypothetical protein